jgi:predicted peptidase
MGKKIPMLVWMSMCIVVGSAQDMDIYEARWFVASGGDTMPYRIMYPEAYDRGKSYPLIIFLHGAGERGRDNALQLTHGARLFASAEHRKRYPAIVVFPQCPAQDYWASVERDAERVRWQFPLLEEPGRPMGALLELLDFLMLTERVNQRRVYVAGLSMGGMGTFELLARRPGVFAAAVPICGGGNPVLAPIYATETAMWLFHGDADVVVPVALSRKMAEAIKQAGNRKLRYTEYAGVNHDSWTPAFAEPAFMPWLFRQHKKRGGR